MYHTKNARLINYTFTQIQITYMILKDIGWMMNSNTSSQYDITYGDNGKYKHHSYVCAA